MSVRVIIADDHALWRAGLRQLLEAEGLEVAGEAATGDEALEAVRANPGAVTVNPACTLNGSGRIDREVDVNGKGFAGGGAAYMARRDVQLPPDSRRILTAASPIFTIMGPNTFGARTRL